MSGEPSRASPRLSGRLIAATHNPGKLREIRELMRPHGIEAVSAAELTLEEPEETGATFRDNAALKAQAAARASGIVALADGFGALRRGARWRAGNLLRALGGRGQGLRRRHGPRRA